MTGNKKIFKLDNRVVIGKPIKSPHKASLMNFYSHEVHEKIYPWCQENIKDGEYYINIMGDNGMGYVAFKNEFDLTLFLLRWT